MFVRDRIFPPCNSAGLATLYWVAGRLSAAAKTLKKQRKRVWIMKKFIFKTGICLLAAAVFNTAGVNSLWAKGPGGSVSHVSAVHSSSGTLNLSGKTIGKLSTSEVPVPKRSPHQDQFHLSTSFNESQHVDGSQMDSKLPSQVLSQFNSQKIVVNTNDQVRPTSPKAPTWLKNLNASENVATQTRDSQFVLTKAGVKNINGDHIELTDAQTGSGGEAPAGGNVSNPPLQSRPSSNFEHDNDYYNLRLDPMTFSGSQSSNGTVTHLK
jgi:hypothetical protein